MKTQKKINNFCIEVNRMNATTLMNLVEIEPASIEQTIIFCNWFKIVLCIKEFEEEDIEYWQEQTKGIKNILLMNMNPTEALEKFRNDEFIDMVFFNKSVYIDYNRKLYDSGFISGKGKCLKIIKKPKKINNYWVAKKQ
jgi:hypothetical protein